MSIYRLVVERGSPPDGGRARDSPTSASPSCSSRSGRFGIVTRTILERRPLVVGQIDELAENAFRHMTEPGQQELLREVFERYQAILAVPIVVEDGLYGALAAYYPQPRDFSDEDVALAQDLADHLALALENAALREQAEESAVSAERSRLARDLHDAVTQTLFSASMIAEVLPTLWERDPEEGAAQARPAARAHARRARRDAQPAAGAAARGTRGCRALRPAPAARRGGRDAIRDRHRGGGRVRAARSRSRSRSRCIASRRRPSTT